MWGSQGNSHPLTRCLSLGVVRTAIPNMDRETQEEFLVVIQAKDMGGHMGGLSGSTTVTVTLSDVNDNPPKFPQSKGPVLPSEPSCDHPPHSSPARLQKKEVLGEGGGLGTSLRISPLHPPPRPVPVLSGGDSWAGHSGGPASGPGPRPGGQRPHGIQHPGWGGVRGLQHQHRRPGSRWAPHCPKG